MGIVYRAQDTRLGRKVALKFLPVRLAQDPKSSARFWREARAVSALNHPNICTLYDVGNHEGQPFIVMECLEGETLASRLASTRLTVDELLKIAIAVTSALQAAHERGILHRDIKPANLFLAADGQTKLLDFGLAKSFLTELNHSRVSNQEEGPLTAPGTGVGTPYYMSPEQLLDQPLDARSDLFSLGVLLYEVATGTLPFKGSDLRAVFNAILNQAPTPPSQLGLEIPSRLEVTILKALEKERQLRYQTAADLMKDLTVLKEGDQSIPVGATVKTDGQQSSIAVLPFVNMSPDPENEHFGDGLAEELINALVQLPGLKVAARTSAFSFKGSQQSVSVIGRQLNVNNILEGSVRKAGERLRITAQLIEAATGFHIWSERYDRQLEDIFDLQDEITQNIVAKLRVKLDDWSQSFVVKRYTENVEAYNDYLKGRYHLNQRTEQSLVQALECFEKAISKDAHYSLPYAGLAEVYILLNVSCPRLFCERNPAEVITKAREAALRAIELDDSSAEAHVAMALVYYRLDWNWKRAEDEFKRAIELNRDLAAGHHQYAMFLASLGRLDEALDEIRRAHKLDPLSQIIGSAMGRILHFARRFDEAVDQFQHTLELNPQSPGVYFDLGLTYTEKGLYSEAISAFRKLGQLSQDQKSELMELAWMYGRMGERQTASRLLEKLMNTPESQHLPHVPLALIHLELGDSDKAFELFDEGYTRKDSNLVYLRCEPAFDLVRKDPRFQHFLRRLNLSQEATTNQLNSS